MAAPAVLLTLLLLSAASALFVDQIASFVGSLEGTGTLTYTYIGGTNPVTSITFELPAELGGVIIPDAPAGFGSVRVDNNRWVVDVRLNPGESLRINYHLARYLEPGGKTYMAVATTESGETLTTQGSIQVPATGILRILVMIQAATFPVGSLLTEISQPIGVLIWSLIGVAAMALAGETRSAQDLAKETAKKAEESAKKTSKTT